ncbi:hypothetical protein ACPCSP_31460 [Streptomyces cinereoruber]|uniref:hypothetical protein n=1 Tax=Streptomyces cinereoruber TaxID=67260 RepID=UPI003C2C1299
MKTRETASAGYRLALEAHLAAVAPVLQGPAAPDDGDSSHIPADAKAAFADHRARTHETASAIQDAAIRRARAERAAARPR